MPNGSHSTPPGWQDIESAAERRVRLAQVENIMTRLEQIEKDVARIDGVMIDHGVETNRRITALVNRLSRIDPGGNV